MNKFMDKLKSKRIAQREAGSPLDKNYYYKDTDVTDIIELLGSYMPHVSSVLKVWVEECDYKDVKDLVREEVNNVTFLGYRLQHESQRYSVENRPMYYGV